MKLQPYWLDSTEAFKGGIATPVEGTVDVAVVGGGFTGLAAALALAKKGASVAVIEAGRVGGEASGRNGGHVNSGLSHDYRGVVARMGRAKADELYHAFDDAVDLVESIVREEQIVCHFQRRGKLKLAAKPHHYDGMRASYEVMVRDVDPDLTLVPPERIREEIGSDQFFGGMVYGKSAQMHMGRFAAGLADAATRRGVRIYENAPMTRLDRLPDGRRLVCTARGSLVARQVFLATGVSSKGPLSYFRRRIIPISAYNIATEPLSDETVASVIPHRRTVTTSRIVGNYFRISPDNRLIFGGRARFALPSPSSDTRSATILEQQMLRMFPQLAGTRIDYCWGGLVDVTADRFPRGGERDGVYYAMGYSGHGTQMSVYMGTAMAEIMDGKAERNPFRGMKWSAVPGHFGPPWFLPAVGVYFRMKDRFN